MLSSVTQITIGVPNPDAGWGGPNEIPLIYVSRDDRGNWSVRCPLFQEMVSWSRISEQNCDSQQQALELANQWYPFAKAIFEAKEELKKAESNASREAWLSYVSDTTSDDPYRFSHYLKNRRERDEERFGQLQEKT